jgi:alkanesulfonate monooxygenase SsuD/methylene tetrahydromethanopterin reductase-like flavin-dependent oxidoreductase (luciferase family)
MELGFFTVPVHPLGKDWRQSLREDREALILADQLGFCEAYVGEHATDQAENITSCTLFLATLAETTERIRLGTGTINRPNNHPASVAAQIAMLDHLFDGRLIFGISPGGLPADAEMFSDFEAARGARFIEAIDQVLAIWRGGVFCESEDGAVSALRALVPEIGRDILSRPWQHPHPPVVVTAATPFCRGVTEAASRGWDVISANFLMPASVATHWPDYVEGCRRADRPALPANWRIAKSVFVADDEATARAYTSAPDSPYRFYYRQLLARMTRAGRIDLLKTCINMADEAVTLDNICETLIFCGTAESVADQILAFREEVGAFGTLLYAGHDWADPILARRSMVLMAEKVLPAVNRAIGLAAAAE